MKLSLIRMGMTSLGLLIATPSFSVELFRDQLTDGSSWATNKPGGFGEADSTADFGYDYSAVGIPEAPNSLGGDTATSGLKLTANNGDALDVGAWQTLYPVGQSFSGNYQLSFDAWMNYDAVEANEGAATGTTEFLGGGIGYQGTANNVGVPGAGIQALATGDGGSGSDWRVFKEAYFLATTDMIALSRNGAVAYHADYLPGVEPPAIQGQVGATPPQLSVAGSPGFQWVTWHISTIGDTARVFVEKPGSSPLLLARFDTSAAGLNGVDVSTDGNISLVYADFFASVTPQPNLTYGVIDNVVVTTIPEPGAALLAVLAVLGSCRRTRRAVC